MNWILSILLVIAYLWLAAIFTKTVMDHKKESKMVFVVAGFIFLVFLTHSFIADAADITLQVENKVAVTASVAATPENTANWTQGTLKTMVTVVIP